MEASLLVAPKPSMPRTIFSARRAGRSWRCLVVAATIKQQLGTRSESVDVDAPVEHLAPPSKATTGARGGLLAAVATTTSSCTAVLPCHALSGAGAVESGPWWWTSPLDTLYRAAAVLGDLDPATARAVAGVAGPVLSAFGFLFILRIVMSWYPRLPVTEFPYVVAYAPTEPFLAVTRRVIPPLGGVDVTPVVWFGLVSFASEILVGPQGLLVLLSQQR
ncbi:Protein COFACTOR ASSEMBLY OF COMPLEX C SUBUNIT B CCB3, chloroplastic [Zea mays]|uniref:Protein COFACTOR ASSEMBLY OF COMPLEX C SUBUNIT B CCB3 chloroplastic n=2 Tax=Zea mays TaxID=4577 RepID=C0P8A3_MAIZE|nr:uncharacterized protein LOC100382482 [Zea mays]ACN29219.1 unknown [Zea mays]AQK98046.1 Protein COFACTOR ASSEMBLY OF COMPLEX C SUBUNIT B CCB3 chloroplastic [Zea mays]PWZ10644.1 Protein COFACTOR ASSEMBLY OF COMPLEX C SUBUNIT B CCB3, chloroplastic [Zea mays]|eukprot:NP_001168692.1 uncharacterized protein LOC100382482 [Zea mays]